MDIFQGVMGTSFMTKILFILIYFDLIFFIFDFILENKRVPVFHIDIADSVII